MVRFLFRGFDRETGEPIDGHVEASDTEAAYQVLSDRGIVTEPPLHVDAGQDDDSIDEFPGETPDDRPDVSLEEPAVAQFSDALRSAIDQCSAQVPFDALTDRFRGKKIWVVDREKIRHRVVEVVDSTLAASEANRESGPTARERVADAISGLFEDTRNIASQQNSDTTAKSRATTDTPPATDSGLAEQIGRLSGVVEQAEDLIAAMQSALRSVESGGAPRRRVAAPAPSMSVEQNGVLREIFQSNLDLRREIAKTAQPAVKTAGTN